MASRTVKASAQAEKRLFISLMTRDISLVAAILDLIDNSINSAIIEQNLNLDMPVKYLDLLTKKAPKNIPTIDIEFSHENFTITDSCGGISMKMAQHHVFRFGHPIDEDDNHRDTLSVYGIGLKRAMFKIGNVINLTSSHPSTGFNMNLNVKKWERTRQKEWTIPISPNVKKVNRRYGTRISITEIFPDISRRMADGRFRGDLIKMISRTYNYFLERVVRVRVSGDVITPTDMEFGDNKASEQFLVNGVACAVMAGISVPKGKFHTGEIAGWYVFCNGRAVAFADKTNLTGWGLEGFLPNFQPKFRPFIGLVFFSSSDPELLPWTTTKASVDQENAVWQHALRVMSSVGKQITSVLDKRYSDDGTLISKDDLQEIAGRAVSAFSAISARSRSFQTKKSRRTTTSIQYKVKIDQIDEVKQYLGRRSMPNGEVGRHVFDHFLDNVVRE